MERRGVWQLLISVSRPRRPWSWKDTRVAFTVRLIFFPSLARRCSYWHTSNVEPHYSVLFSSVL